MNEPFGVCITEGFANLSEDVDQSVVGEVLDGRWVFGFKGFEDFVEGPSIDHLHGVINLVVVGSTHTKDGGDAWVLEPCGCHGLTNEALTVVGPRVFGLILPHDLEGDDTIQLRVSAKVDESHASAANLSNDLVVFNLDGSRVCAHERGSYGRSHRGNNDVNGSTLKTVFRNS